MTSFCLANPVERSRRECGITLVEILIVIAIISMLILLMLPAVQSSRESARQTKCVNNLRQLAVATQSHLAAHRHFPTGGWTHRWMGDPDRGFGENQPGGWCFTLLPFLGENSLYERVQATPMNESEEERESIGTGVQRRTAAMEVMQVSLSVFNCPTRRESKPYTHKQAPDLTKWFYFNSFIPEAAGRSDYAANIGDLSPHDQNNKGPRTLIEGDAWIVGDELKKTWVATKHNGMVAQRSTVEPRMVTDGLSKTYLYGEKFMSTLYYENGESSGDNQSLYVGFDRDNVRSTFHTHPPMKDKAVTKFWRPTLEDDERLTDFNFGSAHPDVFDMALADGSVQSISYDIDLGTYSAFGNRSDGRITQQ